MRRSSRQHALRWISLGAGLTMAVWALFEPRRGAARRAMIRDKARSRARGIADAVRRQGYHLRWRAAGAVAEARARLEEREHEVPDGTLEARVRAQLGRSVSHPGALEVRAHQGCVDVSGPILAHEAEGLLAAIRSVRGVTEVIDRLDLHRTAGDTPSLQGLGSRPSP